MERRERVVDHQIHPIKPGTDWTAGALSCYLLQRHRLLPALAAQSIPPLAVSLVLLRWADLEPYRHARLGRDVGRHMTPTMQLTRLAGNVVLSIGAWYRRPWLVVTGLLVVLFGWTRGWLLG